MIDAAALLADARKLADRLVDDLRKRTESHDESRIHVQGVYSQATAAGRTDKTFEEWREDLLAQVAAGWVLGCVFVRFCEDNGLYDTPLLSGPADRRRLAGDHRASYFADDPTADDRDWLREVFGRYAKLPGTSGIFGERNPLWQLSPGPDGAKALVELWWATDHEGRVLRHDFTDESLDTRFLGDLYQDLSEHARKQYALLQTPEFVEEFILDRTLDPAIETFGLAETKMIDPTCGSGHFLLGAFDRLLDRLQQTEPGTDVRELAQRALDAVNGVDINPFAVAIARFRLLVAALQASSIRRLADAPDFDINVVTGDSLLHGSHGGRLFAADDVARAVAHHYPTEDVELAERTLQADRYHVVVGNPPYITVKDPAMRDVYRSLYESCSGKYALSVPFAERFHDLARPATATRAGGYVGQITANSFMKREMGRRLVREWLPTRDLTHVIDTSGAYIPGHGTPTVILLSRDRSYQGTTRAVLGIRGEPGRPADPATADVWSSILAQTDHPGSESDYISVEDVTDGRFFAHPWSLQGGAAPKLKEAVEHRAISRLESAIATSGFSAITGEDGFFAEWHRGAAALARVNTRAFVTGEVVRDWDIADSTVAIFPEEAHDATEQLAWPYRATLRAGLMFGKTKEERGDRWFDYAFTNDERLNADLLLAFAFVATHNHFVLSRGGKVFKQTAPVIKLPEAASELAHLELLGLLNSSVACFWMKQVSHDKGNGGIGGGIGDEAWEPRYEFDSTKLKQFPLPAGRPLVWSRALDDSAHRQGELLPAAVAERAAPTRAVLDAAAAEATALRARMVALQEELDWACYHLYGLTDQELTFSIEELPLLRKGERAFEIALARRMAAGEAFSTWFDRHSSTPITELPEHWPSSYRQLVERRLELIGSDRAIGLLERPEYKRRWNWAELPDLERDAQRTWLLDRLEALLSSGDPNEPEVTTVARLADQLLRDDDARAVLEDLVGAQADPVKVVGQLVASAGVPYLAAMRLKESGLRARQAWERTWALQRIEDDLDARAQLPADHPDHLDASALAVAKKEAGVDKIPVPPKYKSSDFRDQASWRLRGKLDVPKERFVLYPRTHLGADTSAIVGWAGWDHLQQLRALAGLYTSRKHDGAEVAELTPMLAGMAELLPWVLQWHDDPDPVFGDRMGQYFTGFLDSERAALGLTADDLTAWRP
ncbi:BREX-2 system adenine-specific DNA-methyltransferase PglX [Nitriliruptoraceae bacterium ZYF776]|nr:BREX-2 system adenine-specific DNA-methyltransferase PglX [Profundirhabdus halotolerans]